MSNGTFAVSKPNTRGFTYGNDIVEVDYSGGDVDLPHMSILVVGTAGDLKVDTAEASTVTLPSALVAALVVIPFFCSKVYQTGTDATDYSTHSDATGRMFTHDFDGVGSDYFSAGLGSSDVGGGAGVTYYGVSKTRILGGI